MEAIQIERSNRKTLSLLVTREGKVIVRAPMGVPEKTIFEFVQNHESWIRKKREIFCVPRPSFRDGETVSLFGTKYLIASGKPAIREGKIFLGKNREECMKSLLKKFSEEVMSSLTESAAKRFGFSYSRVRISSARGRWGSCNREGVIAYSFRVAFLDPPLCEYVAVHELCHTRYFDHSPAFWKEVEKVLPDWKIRRKALKSNPAMTFL